MRKILFYIPIFFFPIILLFFFLNTFLVREKDIIKYHKIISRKTKLTSCKKLKRPPINQEREKVQKDIFFMEDGIRKHIKINSEKSNLSIIEKNNKTKLIENLENVTCLAQEKIYFSHPQNCKMQKIRFFTAKNGIYIYPEHKFFTNSINLKFFDVPGIVLPESIKEFMPYLDGIAEEVSFSIHEKNKKLNAKHFKASFNFR